MEKLTPRAVIFDLGSTLIEYESLAWTELMYKAYSSVWSYLKKQGYDVPEEEAFKGLFDELNEEFATTVRGEVEADIELRPVEVGEVAGALVDASRQAEGGGWHRRRFER